MEEDIKQALINFIKGHADWSDEEHMRFNFLLESVITEAYERGWADGKDDAYQAIDVWF